MLNSKYSLLKINPLRTESFASIGIGEGEAEASVTETRVPLRIGDLGGAYSTV
jgi:hypothetical protein